MDNEEKTCQPPIGLVPKFIRDEQRIKEIEQAMLRYLNCDLRIPLEWLSEYSELIAVRQLNG